MTKAIKFDWAQWDLQKNEIKQGVSRLETDSTFFDPDYKLFKDIKHSSEVRRRAQ